MDESDTAFEELLRLQQTLTSARGRLADLVLLLDATGPPVRAPRRQPALDEGGPPAGLEAGPSWRTAPAASEVPTSGAVGGRTMPASEGLVGVEVLPPTEELCAQAAEQDVPEALVLPAEVDAPPVVVTGQEAAAQPVLTAG